MAAEKSFYLSVSLYLPYVCILLFQPCLYAFLRRRSNIITFPIIQANTKSYITLSVQWDGSKLTFSGGHDTWAMIGCSLAIQSQIVLKYAPGPLYI